MPETLKKGYLILRCNPVVFQLNSDVRGQHCDYCFKRNEVKKCSQCKIDFYCNVGCQRNAWKKGLHKLECPLLQQKSSVPDTIRLFSKVFMFLKNGGHNFSQDIDKDHTRKFSDLMSHKEMFETSDLDKVDSGTNLINGIENYIGKAYCNSRDEFIDTIGKVSINLFSICDSEEQQVLGSGLYLNASVFDHSCQPTAIQSFEGTTLSVRLKEDIQDYSLNKVTISYTDAMDCREDRQMYLKRHYYFDCHCDRCENDYTTDMENALCCGNPSCSNPVFLSSLRCSKCSYSDYPFDTPERYMQALRTCKEHLSNCLRKRQPNFSPFAVYKRLLDLQNSIPLGKSPQSQVTRMGDAGDVRSIFHPENLWRTKTLDEAMEAAVNEQMWDEALALGLLNQEGMKLYYGEFHPSYGIYLAKLGKLSKYLNNSNDSIRYFKLSLENLFVCFGTETRITHEIKDLLQDAIVGMSLQGNSTGYK